MSSLTSLVRADTCLSSSPRLARMRTPGGSNRISSSHVASSSAMLNAEARDEPVRLETTGVVRALTQAFSTHKHFCHSAPHREAARRSQPVNRGLQVVKAFGGARTHMNAVAGEHRFHRRERAFARVRTLDRCFVLIERSSTCMPGAPPSSRVSSVNAAVRGVPRRCRHYDDALLDAVHSFDTNQEARSSRLARR
jgi:hypothetical protein